MEIDLELYRRDVRVSISPPIRLSVIDIAPERPRHTIVFIHGYGGNATQWQYQLNTFSLDNRVIALDLRGHGRSDKPSGDYSMARILEDLENALGVLGVSDKIVLVGHSFGGAVVTEYAAANPTRIERLVLIATAGEFRLNPIYRFLLRFPLPVLKSLTTFVKNWLSAPPYVMHAWYYQNVLLWNGWSLFRDLSVPTMVIRGHRDLVFDRALFDEVTRAIPGAEEVDVGASGHMVMLERREAVNRALHRFLDLTQSSWRAEDADTETSARAEVRKARPWLVHYEDNVPYTIAIPRVPLHQLLRSSARRFPKHPALIFEGNQITYQQLNREANRFANAMHNLSIEPGDRVMLLLPNIPQMVIGFFGVLKMGAVPVFSLPTTDPNELIRQVMDSGARVLVTTTQNEDLAIQAKSQLDTLNAIVFANASQYLPFTKRFGIWFSRKQRNSYRLKGALDRDMYLFRQIIAAQKSTAPEVDINIKDLAVIQYTGGTTADPKGVMLSHYNLVANALQTRHWIPDAREGRERFLCVIPFSHSYGLTAALTVPIALGATLILKAHFEVEDILKTIKHFKPTIFPGVPQMYVAIKDMPGVRKYGINSIKACISGSAPLPMEVQETFEKLTHGRLVEGYGLTEAAPVTHANPLNGIRKVGSIGIPLPNTEARVVGLRHGTKEVPTGMIGELAVRGPQVMMGYWQDPEATDEALRPLVGSSGSKWLLTGDVAQVDAEGYFRIIARKADLWYPGKPDEPAFPRDVEEVLFEVPQVKEAAIVAIAGQPIAFVIAQKERPTAQALIAYCKRRLPPELVPRLVIFVDDFPRSFIGKVLRRELAKLFEENNQSQDITSN